VYPGSIGSYSGSFGISSPDGSLDTAKSGPVNILAEGVVGTSTLGANFGNATYTFQGSDFSYAVPGYVGLSPSGGSYFNVGGLFLSPTLQVNSGSLVTPSVWYAFTETYNGFRLATSSSPFTLSSIEGYAWGQRVGVAGSGAQALPVSYSPNGGYFVLQNIGTAAAAPGVLTPNWLGVTGSISGRVAGAIGSTLTGTMTFTGTSSLGTVYAYQGNVALSPDGQLIFYYNGTATTTSGQTITQSGTMQQVPGTHFTETVSGNLTQTGATSTYSGGQTSVAMFKDSSALTGSRTMNGTTTPTTSSLAGLVSSTVNTFPAGPNTQSASLNVEGVVAGADYATRWGVATGTIGSLKINGVVTLDPTGQATGQFVDQIPNASGAPDNVSINAVSVPTGTGQTTSSFVQTLSGTFNATANSDGTQSVTTGSFTGTSTGSLSGAVSGSYITNNSATVTNTLGTNAGNLTAYVVGAVGGTSGGVQTGVSSSQMVRTITSGSGTGGVRLPRFMGTATLTPASGSVPAALATTLNSPINLAPNGAQVHTLGAMLTNR
jgi:hypothetical protein